MQYNLIVNISIVAKVDGQHESKLVVQALRINTLSKLTFSDSIRFDALVKDVFPGIEFKDIGYEKLRDAIREVCKEMNLVVNDTQVIFLDLHISSCILYCELSTSDSVWIVIIIKYT